MISYKAAVASTPGGKSSHNGDNFYFNTRYLTEDLAESQVLLSHKKNQRGLQIYAVCDGSNAGSYEEEASLILAKNLTKYHKRLVDNPTSDVPKTICEYIDATNEQVNERIKELLGKRISSTLALLCVERESTLICSVGDSRVYLYKEDKLTQLTEDHTQAQRMVQLGLLAPERAATHVKREKLTQYFGEMPAGMSIEPFMETMLSGHGDTYLLCTRGFYDTVPFERMEKILAKKLSPADTVDELMAYAMDAGVKDDATVIVVTAYDSDMETPAAGTVGAAAAAGKQKKQPALFAQEDEIPPSSDAKQQFEEYNENYEEPAESVDSFIGKLLSPFRRGGNKNSEEFWPALIIFAICILAVIVLSVFGYNLYRLNRDSDANPTMSPDVSGSASPTSDVTGTPYPSGSGAIVTAPPQTGDVINTDDPIETPDRTTPEPSEPTEAPTRAPTEAPTPTPTQAPTPTPTEAPSPTPTQAPTEEPTPSPTPSESPSASPSEEPSPSPSGEPAGE